MIKIRHTVVGIISIIYLMIFLIKVEIPNGIFMTVLSIVLINQAVDEWNTYKQTKEGIHLLIPITLLSVVIVVLVSYIFFK